MVRIVLLLTPALLLGACVLVDARDYRPQIDPTATRLMHGRFSCTPSYRSHAVGFEGPPSLAATVGGVECDSVFLDAADGPAWLVSLERYGVTSVPRRIDSAQGLALTAAGAFSLPTGSNCGGGPGSDCHGARVSVFVDTRGDLVTVQDRGDGGVLTALPERLVGTRLAIFPRVRP